MRTPRTLAAIALALTLAACAEAGSPDTTPTPSASSAGSAAATTAATPAGIPTTVTRAPDAPAGCNSTLQTGPDSFTAKVTITTRRPDGLEYGDFRVGCGSAVTAGSTATVQYTGWLQNGTKFDSSRDRGQPFPVQGVGQAQVITCWNEGLLGMRAGGKRRLICPPAIAYGPSGSGPIPANATLTFDVEVLQVG